VQQFVEGVQAVIAPGTNVTQRVFQFRRCNKGQIQAWALNRYYSTRFAVDAYVRFVIVVGKSCAPLAPHRDIIAARDHACIRRKNSAQRGHVIAFEPESFGQDQPARDAAVVFSHAIDCNIECAGARRTDTH
jgi:hypothetical protein